MCGGNIVRDIGIPHAVGEVSKATGPFRVLIPITVRYCNYRDNYANVAHN